MAANDLNFLARRMSSYAAAVERNAPQVVIECSVAISPLLVYATPVDTSRARANWQCGIGTVPSGTLFAYPDKPPSPDYGAQAAVSQIVATSRTYAGGSYIAIANNLPYIQKLNNGYSAQAPAAFVQQAIVAGIRSIHGFRILRNVN